MKTYGEAPRKKSTNPIINRIFKEAIIHRGLLVVRSFDTHRMKEVDKVVVPPNLLDSIMTVLHLKLNHPSQFQLKQVFERYFFSPGSDSVLKKLYQSCHLCLSIQKFPKELQEYNPSLFSHHPGTMMNIDILKRAGQLIPVNVDLFSSFTTTCFASSEKAEDLETAIIQAVTPIRTSNQLLIRVDRAHGLQKLASSTQSALIESN